ncbi:MAG: hypothetical protein KBC56_01580 [Flavobacterium sp.]|nr:hypothetical protein [Flavobacterium sp.]
MKSSIKDWIKSLPFIVISLFYLFKLEDFFTQIDNLFFKIIVSVILIYSILNIFLDGFTTFSIEENQWADFKRGLDYHIDKMVDSMIIRSKILIVLMLVWIGFFSYIFFKNQNALSIYTFFFVFLFPLFVNLYLIKNTLEIIRDNEKGS